MSPGSILNDCCDALLAIFYPQACHICGASVESRALGVSCAGCWTNTRVFTSKQTVCWKCGLPSPGNVDEEKRQQVRCRRCDQEPFTVARACGAYEGALRAAVLALKRESFMCRQLKRLLVEAHQQYPLNQATVIVPVPLHAQRQKTRGFNQAAVLAQALSRASSIALDESSLTRIRHVEKHRAGMDGRDRKLTVESAFRVTHPALIKGERVLLVDDVFTTGATVSACAQALLEAGAEEVYVLTLARPVSFG